MNNTEKTLDKIVALCKGRGFVYPGSEIYGGLANTWDDGPLGVERLFLAVVCDAYDEEQLEDGTSRTVMHLHPALAPVKAAVLPLSKKLSEKAGELHDELAKYFNVDFDDAGAIGKRYRRQDEIGTPFCITYDFDTETDGCVTVRERDSMQQVRIPLTEVKAYIEERIFF